MSEPSIIARNLRLIGGNDIVAIADLQIVQWRFRFRRCIWRKRGNREWVDLPCDCGSWWNHGDARRFQEAALAAMRAIANKILEGSAQ
jgi:hypothetical protein